MEQWRAIPRPEPPQIRSREYEEKTHPIGSRLQPGEYHPQRQTFLKSAFDTSATRGRIQQDNEEINRYNVQLGMIPRVRNPYAGYSFGNTAALVDLFGTRNAAVKFNPTFNSRNAAEEWIAKQRQRAELSGNEGEINKWKRYGVQELDMDNDPSTINNVVVYSDVGNKRIKAIDGYQLVPRNKKESLRVMYDVYPTKEDREVNFNPEVRKHYKAYFRKYPNPNTWGMHPFNEFVKELPNKESIFTSFRKMLEEYMIKHNFTMYSEEKDKTYVIQYTGPRDEKTVPAKSGQLTVAHYMTILQKLTSYTMQIVYRLIAPSLPGNYDFSKDSLKVKSKANQGALKGILGYRPDNDTAETLITIIPGAASMREKMMNAPLSSTIAFIGQFNYFVSNGGKQIVKLGDGSTVGDAQVHRDIDEINMRSKTGADEITVESIDKDGKYTITDHLIKTKAERAAERDARKRGFKPVRTFDHPKDRPIPVYGGVRGVGQFRNIPIPPIEESPLHANVFPTTLSEAQHTPFAPRGGRGGGRGGRGGGRGGRGGGSGSTVDSPYVIPDDSPMAPEYNEEQDNR
jgi:hypothetical protein